MKRNYFLVLISLSLLLIVFGCKTSEPQQKLGPKRATLKVENLYTKYNIHVMNNGRDIKAHYTNWIGPFSGHSIVPLNTKVILKEWSKGFVLQRADTGRNIYFSYNKQHMRMPVIQYINLITSNKKDSLSQFESLDRKGIRNGKAYLGMTKKGILVALGYPAIHKTPSLKNKYWIYWQNKWLTSTIKFNSEGIVVNIIE